MKVLTRRQFLALTDLADYLDCPRYTDTEELDFSERFFRFLWLRRFTFDASIEQANAYFARREIP